jgi:hypothetical protein
MSARLYAIVHDLPGRLWCGPAAVAAVTGAPTSRVHAIIEAWRIARRGYAGRGVRRTYAGELAYAVRELGFVATCYYASGDNPTFATFRRSRSLAMRRVAYIVLVTDHFVALAGNRLVDSVHRDPILASDWKHQRTRVREYIIVTKAQQIARKD